MDSPSKLARFNWTWRNNDAGCIKGQKELTHPTKSQGKSTKSTHKRPIPLSSSTISSLGSLGSLDSLESFDMVDKEKDDFLSLSLDCFPSEPSESLPIYATLSSDSCCTYPSFSNATTDLADDTLSLIPEDAGTEFQEDDFDLHVWDEQGHGKFGVVFCGTKKSNGRVYAIKRMSRVDEEECEHVEHEVLACSTIRQLGYHPFILGSLGHFVETCSTCLIFPLMSSVTLYHLLPRLSSQTLNHHDFTVTRFFLAQLVLAVSFLHNRDIYHRDIKPENLLINPSTGSLVLSDFGSSIVVSPITDHISDCQLNGTPEYAAPELIHCAFLSKVTPGSVLKFVDAKEKGRLSAPDWWGVGLVAYELFLGALPYRRDSNDPDNLELYFAISSFDSVPFPKSFYSLELFAQDLLKGFLEKEWRKRLGCGERKEEEIFEREFFESVDWTAMLKEEVEHPWIEEGGVESVLHQVAGWEEDD